MTDATVNNAAVSYSDIDTLPVSSPFARISKRVMDIILGLFLLPVALLVTTVAGLWIKLTDGGPIIHRRRVIGPKGSFDAFKIRTMVVNADAMLMHDAKMREEYERNFKLEVDPRVTSLGRFFRRFSLDEFPQVFNVLMGQMTMVGPRMITEPELVKYGKYAALIRQAKPGLTGYWQVNGRQQTSYAERTEMDLYYLSHWSLWMDARIVFQTFFKVLSGEGAY